MAGQTVEVRRSEVPQYLREGCFFQALNDEDDENISVPRNVLKSDTYIKNYDDAVELLCSLRYWGVDGYLGEVVSFVLSHPELDGSMPNLTEYERNFPYLFTLQKILAAPNRWPLFVALQFGDLDMVKYFVDNGEAVTAKCAEIAAEYGHLHCLKYLHDCDCPWTGSTYTAAFSNDNLECFKFAHQNGCSKAEFRWHKNIDESNFQCFIYAYLNNFKPIQESTFLHQALFHDKLVSLKAGHTAGLPIQGALRGAVERGYLECLKYLREQGCAWDERVCSVAAGKGYLDILKYAHTHGCPWDERTCMFAAYYGHLNCLRYAHERGCPWDSKAYLNKKLDLQCRNYLLLNRCPLP